MIFFIIGTRAQLIKMAPVMRAMDKRHAGYSLIFTGQHIATMDILLEDFGVTVKPEFAVNSREVTGVLQSVFWLARSLAGTIALLRKYKDNRTGNNNIVLVHGDTLSTLLGAVAAKLTGMQVAHVESGLRSFNLFHPFPEEITRLLTFRIMNIAFCPGKWAMDNIAEYKCEKINTINNTLLDAVRLLLGSKGRPDDNRKYAVVSVHRFENIFDRDKLVFIADSVIRMSEKYDILFVLHPATRNKLKSYGLYNKLKSHDNIHFKDRMNYSDFINLMARAEFVVTDGGSNQEELYYMGMPTLLLRKATERDEGVGSTVCLSKYNPSLIEEFINNPNKYRRDDIISTLDDISPSDIIVDTILDREKPGS